jgi:hypothetical protein
MSILYNGGSQQPSFNYTNTAMSAWLCESTIPGVQVDNVAAQGKLFYEQFTSPSQAGQSLSVNAVTACPSTEGVFSGQVAATGRYRVGRHLRRYDDGNGPLSSAALIRGWN